MNKAKKTSFKKVAAGALAVITLASYSLPANTGILSTRPTITASATGTANSIHVYGTIKNATGETLKVVYYKQSDLNRIQSRDFKSGESWAFDGDIVKIVSPVSLNFPKQWNQGTHLKAGTPNVDAITTCTVTDKGYEYTFSSPKGNTYQYENKAYGANEVIFSKTSNYVSNDADTHSLIGSNEKEPHDIADYSVRVVSYDPNGTVPSNSFAETKQKGLWQSNNSGTLNNTAYAEWEVTVPQDHTVNINYWVSCEENIDYLNMKVNGNTVANKATNKEAGVITLTPGTYRISAEYVHEQDDKGAVSQNSCYFLDCVFVQFSNHCEKCDYTDTRVYMQIEDFTDSDTGKFAVQNGKTISHTMNFADLGYEYWCEKSFSVYSKERLYFEDYEGKFTWSENIGNFTYNNAKYPFRYDVNVPNPEVGVFIPVTKGFYEYDSNPVFTAKAKKGTAPDAKVLTPDNFYITLNPDLSAEDAAEIQAIIDSPETAKWVNITSYDRNTKLINAAYYVIYNPALKKYLGDDYDSDVVACMVEEFGKYEISSSDITSSADLILLDSNGKAYPNKFISVSSKDEDGNVSALTLGEDYEITSAETVSKAGEFTVTVNGINRCAGTATKTLTIAEADALTKIAAKAADYYNEGNIEYYADANGNFYLPVSGLTNAYRKASKEEITLPVIPIPAPFFKSQSLILSGRIGVNFFLDLTALSDEEKAASYVEFTVNGETTIDKFDENSKNQAGTLYGFTCYVNSVQMADTITAVFHYGDDETITKTYSVLDYINSIDKNAANYDETTLALIHSIADYGHYSQPFLSAANNWTVGEDHAEMSKVYTESYDYDSIRASVKDYAHKASLVEKDITKITYSLVLNAETTINVFVAPAADYTGNVAISINDLSEDEYTVAKQADGRYKIVISNISAHNLGKTFNVKVTTENGVSTYDVSVLSYVNTVLNSESFDEAAKNAVSSIYKYFEATINYRNKK